jgi:hypothetical protein
MYYIELIALSSINKVSFDNLMLMFLLILRRSEDSYKKSNTFHPSYGLYVVVLRQFVFKADHG